MQYLQYINKKGFKKVSKGVFNRSLEPKKTEKILDFWQLEILSFDLNWLFFAKWNFELSAQLKSKFFKVKFLDIWTGPYWHWR